MKLEVAKRSAMKPGARPHLRMIAEHVKGFKGRIEKRPGRRIVVSPDVIPTFDQVVI